MKAIVTGISGQDGAYLSQDLLNRGYEVIGIVRSKSSLNGLVHLGILDDVEIVKLPLENANEVNSFIKLKQPDFIFNLAAQSSVAESFKNPHSSILFNLHSTLNILEAVRNYSNHTHFYQATSSEMFGSVALLPITENTLHHPPSPYAISKSACHHLVRNYRESYNLHASSGILFNHESVLRGENFFIMKIIKTSLDILSGKQDVLTVGNIDISRDFGYAPEYVKAMTKMAELPKADDFIICSGKSISLRDIVTHLFEYLSIDKDRIIIDQALFRPSEINDIYGDNSKAKNILGWNYNLEFTQVLEFIFEEYRENFYRA